MTGILLTLLSVGWFVLLMYVRIMSYRQGIWDGAFNQFLPVVRREMLLYNRQRAEAIFAATQRERGGEGAP